ncbi:MAG: DUF433 domain-containing protein [Synechococcales cyanobacterium RU_4_20]|nr:DUF433 domain-containing protein [Synechococcales cyanobacterium RU_4_20]NJR69129.1 DUF433 domain-containing protein [Synechococcales cyanobacterium CRU_2_2]
MILVSSVEPIPLRADPSGIIRVGRTRITLDTVVTAFLEGCSAEEIREQYPSLQLPDVYSAIGYYLRHQNEVDAYLLARRQLAAKVRQEAELRFNPGGLRDRLLARSHAQG